MMLSSMVIPVSLPFSSVGGLAMPNISTPLPSSLAGSNFNLSKMQLSLPTNHINPSATTVATNHGSPVIVSARSDSGLSTTAVEDVNVRSEPLDLHTQAQEQTKKQEKEVERISSERESSQKPVLYHPSPRNVSNPHDHSLLDRIYREMHESRFINLSPLALLPNLLNLYFSGVVSHPPVSVTFPPPLPKNTSFFYGNKIGATFNDSEHLVPPDVNVQSKEEEKPVKDEKPPLPAYVLVDNLRTPDSHQSKFYGDTSRPPSGGKGGRRKSRKLQKNAPQKSETHQEQEETEKENQSRQATLDRFEKFQTTQEDFRNFPPHDLFMHLSARVQETVACAEAMWEWVLEEQVRWREREERRARHQGHLPLQHREHEEHHGADEELRVIRRMTRHEFDGILSRFEMDMRRSISMDRVLGCYTGWHPILPLGRSTEEKNFDKACRRWEGGKSGADSVSQSQQNSPVEPKVPVIAGDTTTTLVEDEVGGPQATVRFSRTFRIFCAWKPAT